MRSGLTVSCPFLGLGVFAKIEMHQIHHEIHGHLYVLAKKTGWNSTRSQSSWVCRGAGWKGVLESVKGFRAFDTSTCAGILGERGLGLVVHVPSGCVAKINIPWSWPWPWSDRSLTLSIALGFSLRRVMHVSGRQWQGAWHCVRWAALMEDSKVFLQHVAPTRYEHLAPGFSQWRLALDAPVNLYVCIYKVIILSLWVFFITVSLC